MSKKLLSEAQVRRFMSLANIQPLQEMGFGMDEAELYEVEEEEAPMDLAAEEPPADFPPEEEAEEAPESDVELDEELVQRFVDAAGAVQEMADALGGVAEEPEMDAEEPLDMGPEEEPEMDAEEAPEEEEDVLAEALRGVNYVPSQKELVNEVAKRVAKRIMEAKQAQAMLNKALGKTK